ncbi:MULTISPECIES: preprotein translocase subunit SecE [unclassified Candidatus Frackibacter]|uniref:preprotein translocase subunit SecE n=1 Tax=unclassified Candidatus Frackibacter TaxID=2648818 RepID=UPI000793932D|nr:MULTISPECIES: preprotein translocase subunit SecE [unclassified Candidatus Frackibacter]KXS42230.1 MAG: preprotein translocase subunit SecE [Candidatus Frackibacter sp. T328-2]SDC21653.1 preprotein translocase subunit SecE [Candidatus Frackibacter sp. WG11]SEM50175.1 preprotein translocase subunit SecE [Candidatus Frackibacter sp. WG12]SFL51621.1 preprotein translocase subunit SecE [Candidatus Frackibacter sp. WG13]
MAEESTLGKIKRFFREVKAELKKVNWPNQEVLISYTTVVIATVLIVAIFIGGVDLIFSKIITPLVLN